MELRKDLILDRWVIINGGRAKRPHQFNDLDSSTDTKTCYFCPGNENMTPPEIGRLGSKESWKIRWFENKFPIATLKTNSKVKQGYYEHSGAFGKHEIIAETNDHAKQIYDLTSKELYDLFTVYQKRLKIISEIKDVQYVSVFKNHGSDAGTSIKHSHSQIIGYNLLPSIIKDKLEASKGDCRYCNALKHETRSNRRILSNNNFAAFAPYAARFGYEVHILSKKHDLEFTQMKDSELKDLIEVFKKILKKLKVLGCSFNYYLVHYPGLHFHIEICPRISKWAGFELSTDTIVNSISPEVAAKFYRQKK